MFRFVSLFIYTEKCEKLRPYVSMSSLRSPANCTTTSIQEGSPEIGRRPLILHNSYVSATGSIATWLNTFNARVYPPCIAQLPAAPLTILLYPYLCAGCVLEKLYKFDPGDTPVNMRRYSRNRELIRIQKQ